MSDPSPRAIEIICIMRGLISDLPDLIAVEMLQDLAGVIARNEDRLSVNDIATLIGIGTFVAVRADEEMKAGILGFLAMQKAGEQS
jgi:hypothetical protein